MMMMMILIINNKTTGKMATYSATLSKYQLSNNETITWLQQLINQNIL